MSQIGQSPKNEFVNAIKALEANLSRSATAANQDLLQQQLQTVQLQLEECKKSKLQLELDLGAVKKTVCNQEQSHARASKLSDSETCRSH